MLVLSSS